jgi:hypothetical protein
MHGIKYKPTLIVGHPAHDARIIFLIKDEESYGLKNKFSIQKFDLKEAERL